MSSVLDLVAKITLDTSEYDKGLDTSKSKAEGFGSAVKKGFGTLAGLATKAVAGAGAAVVAFGASSVKTGMSFDKAMSQVGATMGKTSDKMEKEVGSVDLAWGKFSGNLREYAQEMGAHTAFSATQAAEALNYMALAGYDTETSMKMLPNVLNLAAAGAMDLGMASDMVTDAQTALGLSTEETTKMVDEMAKTSSTTNTSVSQLGDAILTIGATARNVKGGTAELSQVLGVLADNGIKGSEGGTHLRNMLLSLQNPTKDGAAALEQLGVSVYDADGKMRALPDIFQDIQSGMEGMDQASRDTMLNGLFNKTDLAAANALIGTNKDRWNEVAAAIADSADAAQEMADIQLDNLSGDITLFQSALEGAQIAVSDGLKPALRGFVQEGSDGLTQFTESVKNGDLSGAIEGLGTTIANLAVKVVEQVPNMLSAGAQLLVGIGNGIMQSAPTLISTAGTLVMTLYNGIMTNAPKLVDAADGMITNLGSGLASGIPQFLAQALPMVEQFTGMLRGNAGKLIDAGLGLIMNIAQGIANAIPTLVQYIPQIVINIAGIINDNAPKLLATGVKVIATLVSGIISAIPTIVANIPKIIQAIVSVLMAFNWINIGKNIITFIGNGIKSLATAIPEFFSNLFNNAVNLVKGIDWAGLGSSIITFIVNGITSLITSIPTVLQSIGTNAVALIKGIDWLGVGTFLVEGLISGISSLATAAVDAIKGVGQAILDGFKSLFGINSPSTVMEEQGNFLIEGLTNALTALPGAILGFLTEGLNNVISWGADLASKGLEAASNFAKNVGDGFNTAKEKVTETVGNIKDKVTEGFTKAKEKVTETVGNIKEKVTTGFTNAKEKVTETVGNIKEKVSTGFTNAKEKVAEATANIKEKVATGFTNAKEKVAETTANIKEKVSEGFTNAKEKVAETTANIKDKVTTSFTNAKEKAVEAVTNLKENVASGFTSAKEKVSTLTTDIKDKINTSFTTAKERVSTLTDGIKEKISSGFTSAKEKVTSTFDGIKDKVKSTMESAKTAVSNAVDKIKSKMHFSWHLPHLKMPHVNISGHFSLNPPSAPHFSIEWYKKAMDTPWLFTSPTVIPAMGFGDAGSEIVYGKDSLMRDIREAQNSGRTEELLAQILTRLNQMETTIMLDGRLVSQSVDRRLGNTVQLKQRGVI